MLAKSDLQDIRNIIQEETTKAVQTETRKIVREETREVIREEIKKEVAPLKKDIVKIRKDISTIVNFFDREYLDLRERVEIIESRLGIVPSL